MGTGEGRHFRADQLSAAADGVPPAQLQQGHIHPHALIQGRLSPQVNFPTSVANPDPQRKCIHFGRLEGQNEP